MKLKNILIILSALAAFSSCDFLDEYDPNSVTTENYYQNEADIEAALNGVYASMKQSYVIGNLFYFTDVKANITGFYETGVGSGHPYQLYNFTVVVDNTYVYNRYGQLFYVVARANNLIAHLDDVTYAAADTRDTYEAEARFHRALAYFWLVTEFGDVPLTLTPLLSTAEINAANVRQPKADIYAAICKDLKYVTESPLSDTPSAAGKASKMAAWALWGKVLLQQARDESFLSQESELLADAIVKLETAWGMRRFGALSDIPYNEVFDLDTQKNCPENIYQINYIGGNPDLGSGWFSSFAPNDKEHTQLAGGSYNPTDAYIYNSFDEKDVRKKYIYPHTLNGVTQYYTKKYYEPALTTANAGGSNWVLLRHADVVLMLAEAEFWSGDESAAKTWLNMVRKRAGLADCEETGTALRDAIYWDRTHEFVHEGHGWLDALRKFTDDEIVTYYSTKRPYGSGDNVIEGNPNFSKTDLLYPIPYREVILNPEGLPQNPGY